MPNTKTLPAQVKAEAGDTGVVEAIVATYDTDSSGDRIVPGAFSRTLAEWEESGEPLPFIWSHMHNDLDAYLGDVQEAKEIDEGLWVRAQLDMDDPKSAKAFRLIKSGRVRNYSFAYETLDEAPDEETGDNLLKELKLFEVGPTLIGMNQQTRTLDAKSEKPEETEQPPEPVPVPTHPRPVPGEKAGRVLSAKNEADLRTAQDLIKGVLAQLDRQPEKTSATGPATDKEPERATAKEPSRASASVSTLAAELTVIAMEGERRADSD